MECMAYQGGPYPQYPPTYPPPPPQPPQRPSRWPAFATNQGVLLYIVAPLAALLLIFALFATIAAALQRAQTAGTPSSQQQPTLAPYPTVTAYPTGTATTAATATPAAPAVLGATQDAFTAAYGSPQLLGSVPHYSFTAPDGTTLDLCVCETMTGKDGADHADILSFGPADGSSSSLTVEQYTTLAKTFMPADAIYQNDIHDPDVGTLHVYRSATLEVIFPAGNFENTGPSGGLVPPGTFSVNCDNPAVVGCALRIGT